MERSDKALATLTGLLIALDIKRDVLAKLKLEANELEDQALELMESECLDYVDLPTDRRASRKVPDKTMIAVEDFIDAANAAGCTLPAIDAALERKVKLAAARKLLTPDQLAEIAVISRGDPYIAITGNRTSKD